MFVTGIHPRLSESEVKELFEKHGAVRKANIMRDPHSGESRGFGFVDMESAQGADAAREALQGVVHEGRTLSIEKARRARPRTPTPGKYYGPPKRGKLYPFSLTHILLTFSQNLADDLPVEAEVVDLTIVAVAAAAVVVGMTFMAVEVTAEALVEVMIVMMTVVVETATIDATVSVVITVDLIDMVVLHVMVLHEKIVMEVVAVHHVKIAMEAAVDVTTVEAVATMVVRTVVMMVVLLLHEKTEIHMPAAVVTMTVVMTAIHANAFQANLVRTQTRMKLKVG